MKNFPPPMKFMLVATINGATVVTHQWILIATGNEEEALTEVHFDG